MKKVMTMLSVIVAAICMTSCGNTANDQTSVTDANKQVMEQFIRFINTGDLNHVAEPGEFDLFIGGSSQAAKTARITLK